MAGGVTLAYSAFLPWLAGADTTAFQLHDLFKGMSGSPGGAFGSSMAVLILLAAAVALVAGLYGGAPYAWLGGLVALATVVLWGIRTAAAKSGVGKGAVSGEIQVGVWVALAGMVVVLVAGYLAREGSEEG
ncbi:hypothetical protein D5H75_32795 [Bailinhaonella thermotolerans]|uniref:Uncharacterized protein n=1 Tax=Bailinhaonella thermotolerans TaxID=1070861 RepID=A0A3A4A582_9ACTN|nr:hypothetical protein D5H75_32795 [Bailinhaonella thermotolerans]